MQRVIQYWCEVCGKHDTKFETIRDCECKHLGITAADLEKWKVLRETAVRKSAIYTREHNFRTEAEFDEAIEKLVDFEKGHNLSNKQIPNML